MKNILILFLMISTLFSWMGCEKDSLENSFTDFRDGEVYRKISIGNQTWMAENLRYNAYGSFLNATNPPTTYGRLYDWATVMNGATTSSSNPSGVQGICPDGWHLPSDAEWTTLESAIGGTAVGTAIKSTTGWNDSGNGTNSSGFNVFPAGTYSWGIFYNLGNYTSFWSSTEHLDSHAWNRNLNGSAWVYRLDSKKYYGFSCRCVEN
jgi:uncharacterized protein (TIGR02145 family)